MTMPMASSSLSRPGIAGRALGALFAVLALACFGFSLANAAQAAGLTGIHGTLTVERCSQHSTGGRGHRSTTECAGTFRSDDGGVVAEDATVRAALAVGGKVPVQRSGGSYVRTGFGEITRWIGASFGGWLLLAIGVPFAVTGVLPRSGGQFSLISHSISGTRAGTVRKWLFLGGLAGAAVCLYLTWTF